MADNLLNPDDIPGFAGQAGASTPPASAGSEQAANLIRDKVARIYQSEPAADQELAEAEALPKRSKHQQFMYDLSASGKDLANIQTAWHNYYIGLPALEKHQVWQEFYQSNTLATTQIAAGSANGSQALAQHKHETVASPRKRTLARKNPKLTDVRGARDVQAAIRDKVTSGGKLKVKHHIQSLLFGLGMGFVVIIIFLFSFFNEVIIAPFIQPSRVAAATPIIVGSNDVAPTSTPEVIIPKINVEIPVNYSETSTNESTIESDLEGGIVHYPTTVMPGQNGNAAFFGHSSNNIFNQGKYKFAFVLLHTLVPGDTFYLTYQSKVYIYKVISKTIVPPTDVSVLGSVSGQTATATLITCDPPGTSINRLVVVGQQISPSVSGNTAAPTPVATTTPTTTLPGNGPTLWSRVMKTPAGRILGVAVVLFVVAIIFRGIRKYRASGTPQYQSA